uniref:DUF805 domain-containing protein n=1 Tax=Flavobacterium sp. TaxID=239 RepID=UPI00404AD7E3
MGSFKKESEFGVFDWWKKVVKDNYANFEGRARRAEYWNYVLGNIIITFSLYFVTFIIAFVPILNIVSIVGIICIVVLSIGTIIPSLAVAVRRLHDTNKSGWYLLLNFVPIANIVLIVFLATEGTRGSNSFGDDPKLPPNFINEIGSKEY